MSAKILIIGMANTGKTTLLKSLTNALIVSRDGKPFPFEMPHFNVGEFSSVDELFDLLETKLQTYTEKFKKSPDTIVFDSVSRIQNDIEVYCNRKYKNFDIWNNVNKEINTFLEGINTLQTNGYNIILIAHCIWDNDARTYMETAKGSFAKIGGFLSTVDYSINIDIVGNKYIVTHKGNNLSRTLLEDMPIKEDASNFNLQTYLEKINKKDKIVTTWSI